ncbi:hypothetical protein RF11_05394 [Thelohanellus kitauei]|uniref:Sortilin N-terminal domain-containing protein n=1 Tax=Thelohanellus kitauei TaxID=669202 RepID=A0A0C2MUH7_THEKT|nr:hypothetical protein RF11_05394 [Thelohanellus kitauei]
MHEALKTFISYNGGQDWSYLKFKNKEHTPCKSTQIKFTMIEILNNGELLVGIEENKNFHVSLDTGMTWEKLKFGNIDGKILNIVTNAGFKYNVGMISRDDGSKYYLSILDFSRLFGKLFD